MTEIPEIPVTKITVLDEEPADRGVANREEVPIPYATEPYVTFAPEVAELGERLVLNQGGIYNLLRAAGTTAARASSIYYSFLSPEEFHDKYEPKGVHGFSSQPFVVDDQEGGRLVYRNRIVVPLHPAYVSLEGLATLNHVMRHELGHVADNKPSYGLTIINYADILKDGEVQGQIALHNDIESERFANEFDRQNASFAPFSLKDGRTKRLWSHLLLAIGNDAI